MARALDRPARRSSDKSAHRQGAGLRNARRQSRRRLSRRLPRTTAQVRDPLRRGTGLGSPRMRRQRAGARHGRGDDEGQADARGCGRGARRRNTGGREGTEDGPAVPRPGDRPHRDDVRGHDVGGLSSITWDPQRNVYYAISDDPSQFSPRASTRCGSTSPTGSSPTATSLHRRDDAAGAERTAVPAVQPRPEGLALTKDRTLVATSEGFTDRLIPRSSAATRSTGRFLGDLPVPQPFLPTADHSSGIRPNLAFESAGVPQNGKFLFTGTENALYQDGPAATSANGSPSRIMRYDLESGQARSAVGLLDRPGARAVERSSPSTASSSSCR